MYVPIAYTFLFCRNLGAAESLFERLDSENNTVTLTVQYRMNKSIMDLINKLTYNGELKAGNESIENATFISPNTRVIKCLRN